MNRTGIILGNFLITLTGCETVKAGGRQVRGVVGETANTVGPVTEGGAQAIQGKEKPQDNPYGR